MKNIDSISVGRIGLSSTYHKKLVLCYSQLIINKLINMQNNNNKNVNIIPIVSYSNADKDKFIIYKENKNKSGIYRWNNLVTGNSYVGSALNLTNRLRNYFSPRLLKRNILKSRSIIYNSLLKYGYNKFSLDILEYCE